MFRHERMDRCEWIIHPSTSVLSFYPLFLSLPPSVFLSSVALFYSTRPSLDINSLMLLAFYPLFLLLPTSSFCLGSHWLEVATDNLIYPSQSNFLFVCITPPPPSAKAPPISIDIYWPKLSLHCSLSIPPMFSHSWPIIQVDWQEHSHLRPSFFSSFLLCSPVCAVPMHCGDCSQSH